MQSTRQTGYLRRVRPDKEKDNREFQERGGISWRANANETQNAPLMPCLAAIEAKLPPAFTSSSNEPDSITRPSANTMM